MKIHVVHNGDGVVLGAFTCGLDAKKFVKNVGKKKWKEDWDVTSHELNHVEDWILKEAPSCNTKKR